MNYVKLAWAFVLIMVLVSAAFNFIFGWRIGANSHTITSYLHDGYAYGLLSVASDGMKICLGVLAIQIIRAKHIPWWWRLPATTACMGLFALATVYSLNSAFGSIATNRTDMAGLREAKATNYVTLEKELEQLLKQQSWLSDHRPTDTIKADLAGKQQDLLWDRTGQCTDATVPESRAFCQNYQGLRAELGTAQRGEDLAGKIETKRNELQAVGGKVKADPHAEFLNQLSGYDEETIVLAWLIIVVLLIECGSTFGPIVLYFARIAVEGQQEASQTDDLPESPEVPTPVLDAVETLPDGPKPPSPPPTRFSGKSLALGPFARRSLPEGDEDEEPDTDNEKVHVLRPETIDDLTGKWMTARAVTVPVSLGMQASYLYDDYSDFCRKELEVEPVSNAHFGRSVKRLHVKRQKVNGVLRYGLKLQKMEVALAQERAA
ncbi:MAG TPA: hypothetical protein VFU31_07890 [Candidatus Binatia bacterium]|nr:hypothetical protein [Candidatus Binatia bacterium]